MKLKQEKVFPGFCFRPSVDTYQEDSYLFAVASSWGKSSTELAFERLKDVFVEMIEDTDHTVFFKPIGVLSNKENILQFVMTRINDAIYENFNKEEITSLLEMTVLYQDKRNLYISQCGHPNVYLYRNKKLLTLAHEGDLATFTSQNASPLPYRFLGGYKNSYIKTLCVPLKKEDRIVLLSKSFLPDSFFEQETEEGILKTAEKISKEDKKPFYLSILSAT